MHISFNVFQIYQEDDQRFIKRRGRLEQVFPIPVSSQTEQDQGEGLGSAKNLSSIPKGVEDTGSPGEEVIKTLGAGPSFNDSSLVTAPAHLYLASSDQSLHPTDVPHQEAVHHPGTRGLTRGDWVRAKRSVLSTWGLDFRYQMFPHEFWEYKSDF